MITTLLELVGFASVSYGFGLAWAPLGWIVGGALVVLFGYLLDLGKPPQATP